jgi:sulfite reductase (ferredoxin)
MSDLIISDKVSAVAKRDIIDLQQKIGGFYSGETPEEAFRKFRLTRGVYGQRQPGVQMIRIKLPYGRITADQLLPTNMRRVTCTRRRARTFSCIL